VTRIWLAIGIAIAVWACSSNPVDRSVAPREFPLPVYDGPKRCAGVDLEGVTIDGSPDDQQLVWAVWGAKRVPILWPAGFTAIFAPDLSVLTPSGAVVARRGESFPSQQLTTSYVVCEGPAAIAVID
jgi:hypothetical protein